MIADLLPSWAVAVEMAGSAAPSPLLAEEAAALGEVVPRRRLEFTIGRQCAREALRLLGVAPQPILVGVARQPLWPGNVVGSVTHCDGFCAAAVARRDEAASIGIDAETHDALPADVLANVTSEEERRALRALPAGGVHWDRVLFSAKESIFKAWYPIASQWLGFEDVRLLVRPELANPAHGEFDAELLKLPLEVGGQRLTRLGGRYRVEDGRVLTAVVVGAEHV